MSELARRWLNGMPLALVVSFGLSIAFWGIFGVFRTWPFVIVSTMSAALGAGLAASLGRGPLAAAAATAVIRILAFAVAVRAPG